MPDVALSVLIDRTDLGLSALELNDHIDYYISSQGFLGNAVSYQRNQVTSPYIDGGVTTTRYKEMVTDTIGVEVLGTSNPDIANKLATLVQAMTQDSFTIDVKFGTATHYSWECEASDYTVNYDSTRWIAHQVLVNFSVPRQPVPLLGGI